MSASESLRYQPEFNSKQRLLNPLVHIEDNLFIISITREMYANLYPDRRSDEPFNILKTVKETYKKISELRQKNLKKKMTGLNSNVYCAICLHFILEEDKLFIPPSMFIYLIKDQKVKLENFEKYKTDPNKGFLRYFSSIKSSYLEKKNPSIYLTNYMKNKLNFTKQEWGTIEHLVKDYEKKHFEEFEPASHVLFASILHLFPKYDSKIFGKPISSFQKTTKKIKQYYSNK